MSVHYKFKSELVFDTVSFDGVHISVADLKKAILHQKRLSKCDFGLLIKNAQTEEEYNDDNALIAKNTSVIISRVPLTVQQKRSWDRNESQSFTNTRDESSTSHPVDLSRIDGSENDKINAMMTQSTHDYNPLNYQKLRGGNQTGEVPPSYRCHKCQKQGHWIKNCPLTLNHETSIDVKKSTGIPRSFMVPVEGPQAPGAMMTPTGHYAVPAIDHQAYKEGKKERPPFSSDPEPITEKPEIPDDLLCNYCKDLLTDAVLIPCCGGAFCDECIRSFLIESDKHECPTCNEKDISPSSLIPTRYLRNNVMKFTNETGYAKRQIYRPALSKVKDDPEVEKIVETTVAVLETIVDAGVKENAIAEMEHVPSAILTNPPSSAVEDEAKIESIVPMEPGVKGLIEEGHEVIIPPPPGTEEPLLPIASINPSPEKEPDHGDINLSRKEDYEEDYEDDRRVRDQRRIYNKDPQRDRSGECGRIVDTYRVINKRGSSSPRRQQQLQQQQQQQQQQGDYPVQHGHQHMINQSKGYQNMPPGNSQRYPPNMHYESDIRRSGGDRPGTPTIDEPHLHSQGQSNQGQLLPYPPGEERIAPPPPPPQQQGYNQQQALTQHGAPLLPDPYMSHGHRMPMYPHQQGPHYGPPRYDRPPYQQPGYRPSQPRGSYNGPPRPMRGMHHLGYRGVQPPPMGLARNVHNGNPPGVIDDPLEAFNRMLREKDERDRRLGKHRRRSRTRSRSRSYTRSRSRSFGRRSPPSRISRSRSPPPKRRTSRSPLPSRRSRSPKRRSRDGSRSFSISRSRSYSRSQSPPRVSMSRDRDRDRDRDRERERDLPPRYRSPVRSPPRFQRDRERERDRPRSREPRENYTSSYYSESKDYNYRERDVSTRERTSSRYPSRNQSSQHNIPSLMSLGSQQPASSTSSTVQSSTTTTVAATTTTSTTAAAAVPERKDYYDSYNSRYSGPSSGQQQRFNSSPTRDYHKRFDDVAPPGTEGYYDLPPPGVDHPERSSRDDRDRSRVTKDQEEREHKDADDDRPSRDDRPRERDIREKEDRDRRERDREREKDDRQIHQKEKDERERRDAKDKEHDRYIRRDDDRTIEKRDYEKEKDRYRDERERERDRHRSDDKIRGRERTDRKERGDYDEKERENSRHESRHSVDRKKNKKSSSPHVPKTRSSDTSRDLSPEKKKEKKIKEKKKKKDSIEDKLEKKKKKKKEKKSLKEAIAKNEILKSQLDNRDNINEKIDDKILSTDDKKHDDDEDDDKKNTGDVSTSHDESIDISDQNNSLNESTKKDDTKDYKILNPKLLENSNENCQNFDNDFCLNPPNSNFKPIPEIKNDIKKPIDSLYDGLDDAEINTVITEKYTILPDKKLNIDDSSEVIAKSENLGDDENSKIFEENTPTRASSTADSIEVSTTVAAAAAAAVGTTAAIEKSPKDEFLAPMPELSKWERDEREDEPDDNETDTAEEFIKLDVSTSPQPADTTTDELQSTKIVTSEVLKRAENAIFQKAINAIRPIEIKKISESRKILYQNPEPKSTIDTSQDTSRSNERKTVNVTINVGKNERNVELAEPSMKKSKLDRSKFRGSNDSSSYSPTRLSAKERLGDKVDDDKTDKSSTFYEKDLNKNDNNKSSGKIKSPKTSRKNSPVVDVVRHSSTSDRKVFLEDKKQRDNKNERSRDHHRSHHSGDRYETKDNFVKRERNDNRDDSRSGRNSDNRIDRSDKERRGRTPTYSKQNPIKRKIVDEEVDKKKDKKRDDKKRKRAHRSSSRSKSKDSKRKKEKKHKDKKQKHSKDHSSTRDKILVVDDKTIVDEKIKKKEDTAAADDDVAGKKAGKKNPRLITDRKRSALDEASFEPDYSASESDDNDDKNNDDDNNSSVAAKKAKLDESIETEKESEKVEEKIIKKRVRSASSDEDDDEDDEDDDDDDSSSSVSSSSESDDSSYRKRKKKHKKHKKRKSTKKESSSDSDTYSDSTDSSSDDDKHKKKSKKSKSKSKQSKKKKKSKHK